MLITRRTAIQMVLGASMIHSFHAAAQEIAAAPLPQWEPEPDLSDDAVVRSIVGLRPFREGGMRIEYERLQQRDVIHNYGHGGAGVTMSWGSAAEVVRLAKRHCGDADTACVIGGGVIGLTSALLLRQAGCRVRVVSDQFTPRTTSDIAGAQWSPSLIDAGDSVEQKQQFTRVLQESFQHFRTLLGDRYGVSVRPNYVEADHDSSFYKIPAGILPPVQVLETLPFKSNRVAGRVFTTLFIEPPVFMPQLMDDCRTAGISLETRKIDSLEALQQLPEALVVNCTGLGARTLVHDLKLIPLRGQLVLLKPQALPWLLSHRKGYIFPRRDAVVLGGTVERDVFDTSVSDQTTAAILAGNRGFFSS